jgi:DNA-binding transcriptional ArsR family regulator
VVAIGLAYWDRVRYSWTNVRGRTRVDEHVNYNIRLDIPTGTILNELHHDIFELIGRDELAVRAMKATAHPLRVQMLCVLGNQEVRVQDIVEAAGASQSNILQRLAILLRGKGILRTRKDTNRVFYAISNQRTFQPKGMMREVFCGIEARQ